MLLCLRGVAYMRIPSDYCENSFQDLQTIVAIRNDTAVGEVWPSHPGVGMTYTACAQRARPACELPGYGSGGPAYPGTASL